MLLKKYIQFLTEETFYRDSKDDGVNVEDHKDRAKYTYWTATKNGKTIYMCKSRAKDEPDEISKEEYELARDGKKKEDIKSQIKHTIVGSDGCLYGLKPEYNSKVKSTFNLKLRLKTNPEMFIKLKKDDSKEIKEKSEIILKNYNNYILPVISKINISFDDFKKKYDIESLKYIKESDKRKLKEYYEILDMLHNENIKKSDELKSILDKELPNIKTLDEIDKFYNRVNSFEREFYRISGDYDSIIKNYIDLYSKINKKSSEFEYEYYYQALYNDITIEDCTDLLMKLQKVSPYMEEKDICSLVKNKIFKTILEQMSGTKITDDISAKNAYKIIKDNNDKYAFGCMYDYMNKHAYNILRYKVSFGELAFNTFTAIFSKPIKELLSSDNVSLCSNIKPDILIKVLTDGRFKSQHDPTIKISGGEYNPAVRRTYEAYGFGDKIKDDSIKDTNKRPIYGTVQPLSSKENLNILETSDGFSDRHEKIVISSKEVKQYGSLICVFKNDMRKRTTFTVGDSFLVKIPSLIDEPNISSFDYSELLKNFERNLLYGGKENYTKNELLKDIIDKKTPPPPYKKEVEKFLNTDLSIFKDVIQKILNKEDFTEIQMHGGVTVSDIDYVIINKEECNIKELETLKNLLKSNNIDYIVYNESKEK